MESTNILASHLQEFVGQQEKKRFKIMIYIYFFRLMALSITFPILKHEQLRDQL